MKTTKKQHIVRTALASAFILLTMAANAQPLPPENPNNQRAVPVSGITTLLVVGAAAVGVGRLKRND
jgi:hypothetical protein